MSKSEPKTPEPARVDPPLHIVNTEPHESTDAVTDPAPLSSAAAAHAYSELVDCIGAELDRECDELIDLLNRIKEANSDHRSMFARAAAQYSGFVTELTGAAGDIRERVDTITLAASTGMVRKLAPVKKPEH